MNDYRTEIALPTGTRIRVGDLENEYYDGANCTLLFLEDERGRARAWSTYGSSALSVGEAKTFRHDQTGRDLGFLRVVAIVHTDGSVEGTLPTAKSVPFWVAK